MNQKIVKIKTADNIEHTGLLYSPIKETKKVVVHVHGLAGNFYENSFIDFQAESFTKNGYSYFVFNNRGNGHLTDLIKKENNGITFVDGGATFELFESSYYDIESAINYALSLGYEEIILQGHSYGCNKVIYYYLKSKIKNIKKIILLAPCDIYTELKSFIDDYDSYVLSCKEKVATGLGHEIVFNNIFPPEAFSAQTFISDFLENVPADIFRYRNKDFVNEQLTRIDIPVLIQIGNNDNYALTADKNDVIKYLNNNFKDLKLLFIENTNHGYVGKEQEMSDNCIKFII